MAVSGRSDSTLGAAVGLTDADLIEMYRLVALARAVDERMWILNRAGRIPFVISGQGHEGAQVAMAWPTQTSSRCTAWWRSRGQSTSGCGSSTAPAGSRS